MKSTQQNHEHTDSDLNKQRQTNTGHKKSQEFGSNDVDFDNKFFIQLHQFYGNDWKQISSYYEDKDFLTVKKYFNSLLRKSLKKLNFYIKSGLRIQKKYQPFKLNFLLRLANLVQSQRLDSPNNKFYKNLFYDFLILVNRGTCKSCHKCNQMFNPEEDSVEAQIARRIIESFRQIEKPIADLCSKKNGKSQRKNPKKRELKRKLIQKVRTSEEEDFSNESISLEDIEEEYGNEAQGCQPEMERSDKISGKTSDEKANQGRIQISQIENSLDPMLFKP